MILTCHEFVPCLRVRRVSVVLISIVGKFLINNILINNNIHINDDHCSQLRYIQQLQMGMNTFILVIFTTQIQQVNNYNDHSRKIKDAALKD